MPEGLQCQPVDGLASPSEGVADEEDEDGGAEDDHDVGGPPMLALTPKAAPKKMPKASAQQKPGNRDRSTSPSIGHQAVTAECLAARVDQCSS